MYFTKYVGVEYSRSCSGQIWINPNSNASEIILNTDTKNITTVQCRAYKEHVHACTSLAARRGSLRFPEVKTMGAS